MVCSDAPSYDGMWLVRLLSAARLRSSTHLVGVHELYGLMCRQLLTLGRLRIDRSTTLLSNGHRLVLGVSPPRPKRWRLRVLVSATGHSLTPKAYGQRGEPTPRKSGSVPVSSAEERLAEGSRIGRFVVLHDMDGRVHTVAAGSVAAVCETEEGSLLMLPGGKMVQMPRPTKSVLAWLDGRSST